MRTILTDKHTHTHTQTDRNGYKRNLAEICQKIIEISKSRLFETVHEKMCAFRDTGGDYMQLSRVKLCMHIIDSTQDGICRPIEISVEILEKNVF